MTLSDEESADIADRAAAYATSITVDDVPETVEDRAALVILDTVGVCLRGSKTSYVADVAESWSRLGRTGLQEGGATVFADGRRRDVSTAVLLNAASGTTLELDEGNQRSAHPGIHTVPPALAAAEHLDASGTELLTATVAGYEIGARLGDVIRPMQGGLHPHGGWAPVSGAVATGLLLGLDESELAEAIRIAVNPFVVGEWNAAIEGATVRDFYTGYCAQHGVSAAVLAAGGVTGVQGAIARCLLPYTADAEVTPALLAPFDTFGEEFYLTSSYVKMHAACRYAHAPLDALEAVLERTRLDPDDVDRITVETFELGTRLSQTDPVNVLSAKFSTPYALAARLYTGTSGVDAFTEDLVADSTVRSLASRVDVVADEPFEKRAVEGRWGARVTVETADGDTFAETVDDARGGGENPFTREEVCEKFDNLVGDGLTASDTATLRDRLLDIAAVEDVSSLFAAVRKT
jgi:2-methylcitrate dehydratase PrpD